MKIKLLAFAVIFSLMTILYFSYEDKIINNKIAINLQLTKEPFFYPDE